MENGKTRHRFRTLALAMAMLTLTGGQWSASADENTPTLMFGAYVAARNGLSIQASVQAMEARLGRPLAAVRVFDVWDQPFPSSYDLWLRDTGHTLFFSVDAVRTNKVRIPWRSLADSQPGSALYNEIVGWANRIKAFGAHIYFTFNHEPEEKAGTVAGTAADFIDAWRKIVTVFRAQGVTNAEYTWIMTDYAFWRTDGGRASLWYPGDAYVDNIASDAYNWYNCRPGINNQWRSLSWIAGWMRDFGAAHPDKGLFLTEFASHEDTSTPGRKASWINDVQQLFKQPGWEQFQGILYYHQSHKPTCLFWLDSSTTSMAAITALANDPFFGRYEVGSDAPPTAPGKPAASSDAPGQVTLNWQAATDDHATTLLYRIYRDHGTTPVGTTSSSSTGIVSFTDANVPAGTHTYAVSASDGSNEGPQSADSDGVSVADPTDAPPTAPGKPAASSDAPGQVTLNWQAATDDHATTLLYRLYRDQGTTPVGTTSSSSTGIVSFTDTNVPAGTHTYAVSASDGSNEGPRSADSDDVSVAGSTSVFADDFSAGFTNWSGSTAMSLDPSQGGIASPSARAQTTSAPAWAFRTLTTALTTGCISMNVNVGSIGSPYVALLRLRTAANGNIVRVFMNGTGLLWIKSDVSGQQISSSTVIGTGWHNVELCGGSGTWHLYRDGTPIVGTWTANTGSAPIGRIEIGDTLARTFTINYDDVVVDQAPG